MERFVPIPVPQGDRAQALFATRLNCLGSLYYFTYSALRRKRLTSKLHKQFCDSLEGEHIKDVIEFPRDHFKSTICSESRPMWRALPISQKDIDAFGKLGYSDEFIRWQCKVHNVNRRTLLVSENQLNARKLGARIKWHFESNAVYRTLFPESLPTTSETWTTDSLHVRRTASGGSHGEGTFDFIGVGSALQSRHYNEVDQDDLVGKKAIESPTGVEMERVIDYHKLLAGAFENEDKDHDADELVVGNRWAYYDLNSYIREHESWFRVTTHSALGGCCAQHPADTPIFPEEYSFEKLMKLKKRFGSYWFSCQYLNNPASPEDADFKLEWLKYYHVREANPLVVGSQDTIIHEVQDGEVHKDIQYGHLSVAMAVDPAHAGNAGAGRCRHAIIVVGMDGSGSCYLLDADAFFGTVDTLIAKIYEYAEKWKLYKFGLETIAAQRFLAYHIDYRNKLEGRRLKIVELKGEVEAPDGSITRNKEWRIRNVLQPLFESGRFWVQRRHQDFINEYQTFPKGRYVDLLDATAYVPQLLRNPINHEQNLRLLAANRQQIARIGGSYSYMN